MKCLIPNLGSTSLKYRLLDMPQETVLAEGRVERIGAETGGDCVDYPTAIRKCIADVTGQGKALQDLAEVEAVGFKVVHPGPMPGPRLVDDSLFVAMDDFSFFCACAQSSLMWRRCEPSSRNCQACRWWRC